MKNLFREYYKKQQDNIFLKIDKEYFYKHNQSSYQDLDFMNLIVANKEAFFKDRASDNQIQKIWKAPSKIELSKYIKLNRQPPSLLFQNFKFSDSTREKNLFLWQFLKKIIQILDEYVKPAVASDGGNILFDSYNKKNKVVNVILQGACSGCPSSTITLKNGIENILKEMLPGVVKNVVAINE